MVNRRGHSLVELLVALTVGGVLLGAIATATGHAYRTTAHAIRRQEALAVTAMLLDSILAAGTPADGERHSESLRSSWRVRPEAAGARIDVRSRSVPGGRDLAALSGFWLPSPATLPRADSSSAPADP